LKKQKNRNLEEANRQRSREQKSRKAKKQGIRNPIQEKIPRQKNNNSPNHPPS
jgi:hypothetical protein